MTSKVSTSGGTARWMKMRCRASLKGPDSRQSVERLPLVTVEKAKLAALNTQCSDAGAGMLTPATSVMYCSQRVTPCSNAPKLCDEPAIQA